MFDVSEIFYEIRREVENNGDFIELGVGESDFKADRDKTVSKERRLLCYAIGE